MRQFTPATEVDFVVIGSGAGGAVMAKELAVAGFSVVVLEQGGWGMYGHEQDYGKDELLNRFPPNGVADRMISDPTKQRNTFRRTADEPSGPGTHTFGCVVGGGTVTYGASSWRHLPYEFNEKTSDPTIPSGTGMVDYPFTYDEIEPYYTKAEWEIGICGERNNNIPKLFAPMSKPFPVPPQPEKSSGALFKVAAKKLGLTVVPNVAAIITVPYLGRSACVNCGFCSGYGCHVNARSSSAASLLPIAEKTGRCEIRANSYVREISVDTNGKVTGAVYFDGQNREVFQKAKAVVLAANGTESPRLLLMSKSTRFPDGLANSNGMVGRYLMCGNNNTVHGLFDQPLNEYKGAVSGAAIVDYVPSDPKRGFYGGGRMSARGQQSPIQYALAGPRGVTSRWGAEYKKALREQANRKLTILNFTTQMPLESNRVDLDPSVKDNWGLPALRITMKSHPDDIKCMEFFRDKGLEILRAAGAHTVWADPVNDSRGGAHARGSCRMGNDPKSSVVNKFHRAHDVDNLFIVDGSSLVTGGRNHPTMTISAMAYRAADYLVKAAKSGNLKITA
jgi:choline dehydrogenase-like flavoprotein